MDISKQFLLKNLLKLRDLRWEVDEEALSNIIDSLGDELYHLREQDELSQNYDHWSVRREEAFKEWAEGKILSINQ